MNTSGFNPKTKQSVFTLIGELPGQVSNLVKAELAAFKAEMAGKAKNVGIGVGLFAVAGVFAFFATGLLVALAVIALALVLPLWLAALIVFVALLLVAAILVLIGVNRVKAGTASNPEGVTASIRADVDALKGLGDYEH
ncbi:phage holin family protein [Cryobacterium tagatosivorans]|uniref:Phage holin family protein n=1 Tax=Cryobacterium tagatosivorans TaxID=1259199 RepID=A0A4R8UEX1_9MICO|nr:phage holin family protein [Cryobacterium tagatosivorans]TFB49912.1 phage holin family protein [Cryobacterium tagatosivorans]